MANTADLVEHGTVAGERPYTTAEERAASFQGTVNLGRREMPSVSRATRGQQVGVTPGFMRFGGTEEPEPEPTPEPPPREDTPFVTGAMNALDYITRSAVASVGALLPEGIPIIGDKPPTDRTSVGDFVPATARVVIDNVARTFLAADAVRLAVTVGMATQGQQAPPMSLQQVAIKQRADELAARGASDDDALRVAALEETYNSLGGATVAIAAAAMGLSGIGVSIMSAATGVTAGTALSRWSGVLTLEDFAQMEKRASQTIPEGSIGRALVEIGVPELGAIVGPAKALAAARLRFAAAMDEVAAAAKAGGPDLMRAEDAVTTYVDDLTTIERAIPVDDVSGEAKVLRAQATAERVKAQPAEVLSDEDVSAMQEGINAAVAALPASERATVSLGAAIVQAERQARTSMFSALRRMASQPETFKIKNVTVAADADDRAIKARKMVGSFDEAVERFDNALREGGVSQERRMELLAPFRRARHVAGETLAAIEANNAAIRRNVELAATERGAALKDVREKRKALEQASKKIDQTGAKVEKADQRVETQRGKETEKQEAKASRLFGNVAKQGAKEAQQTEKTVSTLEARIADQRARLSVEREIVAKVGGDTSPRVTKRADVLGYPNAEDVRFLQDSGVTNIASWDPSTVRAMADFLRENPLEAKKVIHWDEVTGKTADLTGGDLDKIRKALPKEGAMTRAFYVLNQVFGAKLRAWRESGLMLRKGLISEEQHVEATKELLRLQSDLRGGIGEVARTLAQQRLLKKPDAIDLMQRKKVVDARYADVEKIAKRIDDLEGKIAAAKSGPSDKLRKMTSEAIDAGKPQPPSDDVLRLQGELEAAVSEHEKALAALDDAKNAVNEAMDRNLRAALDLAAKRGVKPDALNVHAYYDSDDLVGLANELRKLEPAGVPQLAQRVLLAGRYGRIPSQILNFFDTGLNALYQESVVSAVAQGIDRGRVFAPKGEVGKTWMGMWGALPDAIRFWGGTFWTGGAEEIALRNGIADFETLIGQGIDAPSNYFRINVPQRVPKIGGKSAEFDLSGPGWLPVEGSLRALYASDGFYRILINNGQARARAMREGTDIRSFVDADKQVREASRERGLFQTYNRPYGTKGVDAILKSLGSVESGGFQWLRVLIPAVRFGARFVEMGLMSAGGGLVSGTLRARRAGQNADEFVRVSEMRIARREQAMGAVGAVQFSIGSMLVGSGVISGPMPTSESERLAWEKQGKKPMSIRVGDNWLPLGWFGAPAAGLAMAAMVIGSATQDDDAAIEDRVLRGAMGLGQWVTDQPSLYMGRQLLDAIWTATQYGVVEPLLRIAANSFKPGAATQSFAESWTAVFDKYQRDPEGFIQLLMAKAPGLSTAVPPKIDPTTGQPMERSVTGPGALLQSEYESAGQTKTPASEVERAIVEVGAGISSMDRTVTSGTLSVRLSQDEYVKVSQRAGAIGKEVAAIMLKAPEYQQADVRGKQSIIQTAYERARSQARREMATQMLTGAKTPEDAQRALGVARASLNADEYEAVVRVLHQGGMLTDQVIEALDKSRPSFRSPTIKQMIGASGLPFSERAA